MKQKLFLLLFLANSLVLFASPEFQQNGYRWRSDNGNQTTATWKAATNTSSMVNFFDEHLRLRILVNETNGQSTGPLSTNPLQYRKNGGSWFTVSDNTSTDFYFVNSYYVSEGSDTTQQISTGSYNSGIFKSNSSSSSVTMNSLRRTEIEYCLAPSTLYDKSATYEFRIGGLNSYTINAVLNPNPSFCETVKPTVSNITYNLNQASSPLTATGNGLLWYTSAIGGTGTDTAPTPITSSAGVTSYWVSQTLNSCESVRSEIKVTIIGPATHLNFDGVNDHVTLSNNVGSTLSGGTAITIEYWFKGTNVQSAVRFQTHGAPYDFITAGWGNGNPLFVVSTDGFNNGVELGVESVIEDNTWHHVACVWKKNEIFATYLDGVLQNSRVAANVNLPLLPVDSGFLGIFGGTIELFKGNLDDVRIWNVARTAEQINSSKNCELQGNETGLLAYYKFNQGIGGQDNTSITSILDATANANNGTLVNFTKTETTSNFLSGSPVTTGSIVPSNATVSTPVVYNQGATASALTATTGTNGSSLLWYTTATGGTGSTTAPTPSTATAGNTSYWVTSTNANGCESPRMQIVVQVVVPATHLNFGGSNDYLDCGNSPSLQITGNTITLEAYVKFNTFASDPFLGNIINKNSNTASGYMLRAGGNGVVNFIVANNSFYEIFSPQNSISLNTWHHIAGVYNGVNLKIYVDGVEVASQPLSVTIGNANINLNIGRDPDNTVRNLDASLDDVRIWNVARTAEQINGSKNCELQGTETGLVAYYKFNQGNGGQDNTAITSLTDATANANNGTLVNFTKTGTTSNFLSGSPVTTGSIIPSVATVTTPVTYNQGAAATALTATTGANGSGLLWYTAATGGTGTTTAPTPSTATVGSTSYWVSSTNANGCESERTEIVVNVLTPATHLNFDGVDDFVAVTTPYTAFTNKITVEFWMNPTILITPGVGFGQGTPNVDNLSNNVWLVEGNASGNGAISFYVNDNGTWRSATTTTATTLNTWQHYTCVADASGVRIYKDGVLNANSPTGISSGIFSNSNAQLHIGKDARYPAGSNRNFKGSLDEFRVWNKVLTATDITNTMNCELQSAETGLVAYYKFNQGSNTGVNTGITTLTDSSGNANNGTLTNFALTGTTSNWLAGSPITTGNTCTVLTLSTSNFEIANKIKMYPNPTNNFVTIEVNNLTNAKLQVLDITGKVLMNQALNTNLNNVDVQQLPSGMYLFKVFSDEGTSTSKIIRN